MSKWSAIENIAIYSAIAAISVGGFWLAGSALGLWSLVLLFVVNKR